MCARVPGHKTLTIILESKKVRPVTYFTQVFTLAVQCKFFVASGIWIAFGFKRITYIHLTYLNVLLSVDNILEATSERAQTL